VSVHVKDGPEQTYSFDKYGQAWEKFVLCTSRENWRLCASLSVAALR